MRQTQLFADCCLDCFFFAIFSFLASFCLSALALSFLPILSPMRQLLSLHVSFLRKSGSDHQGLGDLNYSSANSDKRPHASSKPIFHQAPMRLLSPRIRRIGVGAPAPILQALSNRNKNWCPSRRSSDWPPPTRSWQSLTGITNSWNASSLQNAYTLRTLRVRRTLWVRRA